MNVKFTICFGVLVAVLTLVVWKIENNIPSTREQHLMLTEPAKFKKELIEQVHLKYQKETIIQLEHDGLQWMSRMPVQDLADPSRIQEFLEWIEKIHWINHLNPEDFASEEWKKTGMDEPELLCTLFDKNKQMVLNFKVGQKTGVEGRHFVGIQNYQYRNQWLYFEANLNEFGRFMTPHPENWRDHKLLRSTSIEIGKVMVKHHDGVLDMEYLPDRFAWYLLKPFRSRIGKEVMNEFMSTLLNLEIQQVSESKVINGLNVDVTASGVLRPIKVWVYLKSLPKHPFEMTIYPPQADQENQCYAEVSYRKGLFLVQSKNLKCLWHRPDQLRDMQLTRINPDMITEVGFESVNHGVYSLKNENQTWWLDHHQQSEAANGEKLQILFQRLNEFKISQFVDEAPQDLSLYGLDKPFQKIKWKTMVDIKRGMIHETELILGTDEKRSALYAKFTDEPSVFTLDTTLLTLLPQQYYRWKGLTILRFSAFGLKQIQLTMGQAPPVVLNYLSEVAQWTGKQANVDLTDQIDRVKADNLVMNLAKFSVHEWVGEPGNALQKLKDPLLRIQIVLRDPLHPEAAPEVKVLNFSPTGDTLQSSLFYGQLEGLPDLFYIENKTLKQVFQSVLKNP